LSKRFWPASAILTGCWRCATRASGTKKADRVRESLRGTWAEEHLLALRQAVENWQHYQLEIAACDQRIAKMKDGRTHLAYKAEHAVDLVSEAIVATTVTFADKSDPQSGPVTLSLAAANLVLAGSETELEETVMDKGYHDNGLLARLK
jgi:hypothetical protein